MKKRPWLILSAVAAIILIAVVLTLRPCLYGWQQLNSRGKPATTMSEHNDDLNLPLLLKAFKLPTTTKCSAVYALAAYETVNSRLNVRLRMSKEQLRNVIQASWMQTHGVPLGQATIYSVGVPKNHKAKTRRLWNVEPLQKNDKAYHWRLEVVSPDTITAIVRESGA